MSECPECGSNEIISDLKILTEETVSGGRPAYVRLVEPEPEKRSFMWIAQEVKSEFRAAVCGNCGYTRLHATNHTDLLDAHKKGYSGQA